MKRTDIGSGLSSPVCLLAELPLPHIINGTEAELIGARRDQAIDRHRHGLWLNAGQQDGPGSVWNTGEHVLHLVPHVQTSYSLPPADHFNIP